MVLHKFQTHYSYVFEIEMCKLKLNRLDLKFLESWISKTMLKLPKRKIMTKTSFSKNYGSSVESE